MNRRDFIQMVAALSVWLGGASSCRQGKKIPGRIMGASASVGHMLRDKRFGTPVVQEDKAVVIVGAGVSGLSAARWLQQQDIRDFVVLDLEEKAGGNAVSGANEVSAYPWGAHYVPIPNNTLEEYLQFLKEEGVITGVDEKGLPIYNDYYLCFDPQERLYINGKWQEGVVPHFGVPHSERKQIERFLQLMDAYRYQLGKDGREAFALPVDRSSMDDELVRLDSITMKQWLLDQKFESPYLHWYVNYCTRDDFGTPLDKVSAWAGIHYFACRKGRGSNAGHHDVLTWPAGNGWLVEALQKNINDRVETGSLVVSVVPDGDRVSVTYFDVASRELKAIRARQCIMAVPQFIASRLLQDKARVAMVQQHLQYSTWMVANLNVQALQERSGAPISWDNVFYDSTSLGYVHTTHELLNQHMLKRNLTYYLPLTAGDPKDERKAAQEKTHEQWVAQVISDLKRVHPNIEEAVEEVNVMVWGHAMAQPLPGMIHGPVRKQLATSIGERIHFAHTDLAGVSLFEEAFYQGLGAAKKVKTHLS